MTVAAEPRASTLAFQRLTGDGGQPVALGFIGGQTPLASAVNS